MLTVGDSPRFIERGGMTNLVAKQGRVGFEINDQAVKSAGLSLGSRLLRLALERR